MPSQEVRSRPGPSSSSAVNGRKRPAPANEDAFVYNPRQDPTDRRAVRSDYRALIAQAEESKRDSTLKPCDLLSLINRADQLHERVVAPSESVLDTKTLASMSEMGARMAKKMKLNQDAFDTHEFMTRLARWLGGEATPLRGRRGAGAQADDDSDSEDEDAERGGGIHGWRWEELGRLASGFSKRAVTMDFLLGPLETVPRTRTAARTRVVEGPPAERTAPRALGQQDLQSTEGRESTSQILKVAQLLGKQGPQGICLFKFAIDPDSYVNTIENFFHVSFLIKENKASLKTDPDGNAVLGKFPILILALSELSFDETFCIGIRTAVAQPPNEAEDEDAGGEDGEGLRKKQFIMEIDYETYLESIELYGISESVIPTRPNRVDSLGGRAALAAARNRGGQSSRATTPTLV